MVVHLAGRRFSEDIAREISVVKGGRILHWNITILHAVRMKCSDRFTRDTVKPVEQRKLDFDDMILLSYELFF